MRLRDQVALTLPSFFLRLVLGITFLWAGTGKLMGTYLVTGDDAARLANIGVMPITPAPPPLTQPEVPVEQVDELTNPLVEDSADAPETTPDETPSETQEENQEEPQPEVDGSDTEADQTNEVLGLTQSDSLTRQTHQWTNAQYSGSSYAGSDFPDPVEVKRAYSIALMISKGADPGLTPDSSPINPILPSMLGSKPWPKILAWAAAITELVAGIFLVLGLFTRLSAVGTFSVMLVAMWMTQIGPAAIQSSDAILGFIPRVTDPWSPAAYSAVLWQLAIAAMSVAVFFLGSGPLGVDRLIFKPRHRDPYLHGDPKAAKPQTTQSAPDRSEFDRTPNPTP
jgi:uncharacterized membrane protein YphA (DoxX/SURF4 family)